MKGTTEASQTPAPPIIEEEKLLTTLEPLSINAVRKRCSREIISRYPRLFMPPAIVAKHYPENHHPAKNHRPMAQNGRGCCNPVPVVDVEVAPYDADNSYDGPLDLDEYIVDPWFSGGPAFGTTRVAATLTYNATNNKDSTGTGMPTTR